ncbi:MAG: hypothetical protein Q9222_007451 [Ikaeria aurantiellina]
MHPLSSAELLGDLLTKKPILLLNTTILPTNYLIHLVLTKRFSGAAAKLSNELWLEIISQYTSSCGNFFVPVVPVSVTSSAYGQPLRCKGVTLELGELGDRGAVRAVERFLASTNSSNLEKHGCFFAEEDGTEYSITLPKDVVCSETSAPALKIKDCLFTAITVPDIIAWLEAGRCWVCNGQRDICPGCTRGVAEEFDAFMGCGVELACPLCMGLDFMAEDKEFLEKYYWEDPPDEEAAARKARLNARWTELDY